MDFIVDKKYSRADIKEMAGLVRTAKGSNWDTGLVEYNGEFIIFTNIETEGRTGHNYGNRWEGDTLRWYHKNGSNLMWSSVQRLLEPKQRIHLFWRKANTDPFSYAGLASAIEVHDTSPVEILWSFFSDNEKGVPIVNPEEILSGLYREGTIKKINVNVYERDSRAREACIAYYGYSCAICQFNFESHYGNLGSGFIHVHHLVPLSEVGNDYEVDPIKDLRPVCPNCHAMLHRRDPPMAIEDLRHYVK